MNSPIDPELMLLYIAGAADEDEVALIEQKLCSGCPTTHGSMAEALAVYNAIPLALNQVRPPDAVRHAVLGRITADASAGAYSSNAGSSNAALSTAASSTAGSSGNYANRFRWPVYVSSGLAACLAVGLSISLWNNHVLSTRASHMSTTLANARDVLRSPHVTLAAMNTTDGGGTGGLNTGGNGKTNNKPFGRVLFCPVTRQYQITVYGLAKLPPNKAYELWLISPDGRKIPAGTFDVNDDGTATMMARVDHPIEAANAAITDEPAEGSQQPTGSIQLIGALQHQPLR